MRIQSSAPSVSGNLTDLLHERQGFHQSRKAITRISAPGGIGLGSARPECVWHAACVVAWDLWMAPSDYARVLKRLQQRRSPDRRAAMEDRRGRSPGPAVPGVARAPPHAWPSLLGFWGVPNLQVINRDVHLGKCAEEARSRRVAAGRRGGGRSLIAIRPVVPISPHKVVDLRWAALFVLKTDIAWWFGEACAFTATRSCGRSLQK